MLESVEMFLEDAEVWAFRLSHSADTVMGASGHRARTGRRRGVAAAILWFSPLGDALSGALSAAASDSLSARRALWLVPSLSPPPRALSLTRLALHLRVAPSCFFRIPTVARPAGQAGSPVKGPRHSPRPPPNRQRVPSLPLILRQFSERECLSARYEPSKRGSCVHAHPQRPSRRRFQSFEQCSAVHVHGSQREDKALNCSRSPSDSPRPASCPPT